MHYLLAAIIPGGRPILAPWITDHFIIIALFFLFLWLIWLCAFHRRYFPGWQNRPGKRIAFWIGAFAITFGLCFYGFLFLHARHLNRPTVVATAFSPDGEWKCLVVRNTFVDVIYDIILEPNKPIRFFARPLGSIGFEGSEAHPTTITISWSRDSQLVSVFGDKSPLFAFDLQKDLLIDVLAHPELTPQP